MKINKGKDIIGKLVSTKSIKRILLTICSLFVFALLFFVLTNLIIIHNGNQKMVSDQELKRQKADCILILGAGVWNGNVPSPMLADRLDEGIRLYFEGISPKILVSGDHGRTDYDEVNVMKNYLINAGIPDTDIFMDHAGFSTYESMYRAKEIFGVKTAIIVTQEYHMHRSLYICDQLGVDALGSPADPRSYSGAFMRNVREWIARDKDMLLCIFKPESTYLGETIDIHGDGNVTNDYAI